VDFGNSLQWRSCQAPKAEADIQIDRRWGELPYRRKSAWSPIRALAAQLWMSQKDEKHPFDVPHLK
jgi:hypothetical protein